MWYVVQTFKGKERKIVDFILSDVANEQEKVFIIENELQYRINKEWKTERKPFFPGYVFVEIDEDEAEDFNIRLHGKDRTLKLIEMDGVPKHIEPEEQSYLIRLGGMEHVIRHSSGFRMGDLVEITSGSFKGYTGEIRDLDRHRRRAKVCISFMGQEVEVGIGLEIVKNKTFWELDPESQVDRINMAKVVKG